MKELPFVSPKPIYFGVVSKVFVASPVQAPETTYRFRKSGDPKMRKGLLFAQRTPFREKDFYFCEKDFYFCEKDF